MTEGIPMDRVKERLETAQKALATFREALDIKEPTDIQRDGAIPRFKYTVETTWKAAQSFLLGSKGLSVGSPKDAVRRSRENGVLSEDQAVSALKMMDDRNLTVHMYQEDVAREICGRLPEHAQLMGCWLEKMRGQST